MQKIKVLLIFPLFFAFLKAKSAYRTNCYYGSWAEEGLGRKLTPEKFDPKLCTHFSYAFFDVDDKGKVKHYKNEKDRKLLSRVLKLRSRNKNLKLIAVIGGPDVDSSVFSNIAETPKYRKNFRVSAKTVLKDLRMHGLDLHWLEPGSADNFNDKANLVTLLSDLREEFNQTLSLGVSVRGQVDYAQRWYDIPKISSLVDYINVMAYNYTHSGVLHAPLFTAGEDSVDESIQFWLSRGAPSEKLNLGVALIGRSYKVRVMQSNSMTTEGPYVAANGIREFTRIKKYHEMCTTIHNNTAEYHYDPVTVASFSIEDGTVLTGFESDQSFAVKIGFVIEYDLGGLMIWTIDNDDFTGKCGEKFRLLKLIKYCLESNYGYIKCTTYLPVD
uniref:GH18 domain-containing protein n=1 Tax=Stomoxys calcitrans TaxID=35570 RepID=A0A1I8PB15_STOCA